MTAKDFLSTACGTADPKEQAPACGAADPKEQAPACGTSDK